MEQSFSEARFVARFGRVAQHSLCAYALTLWSAENEYQKREKECQRVASDLASARRLQNKALALKRRVRHSNRKANHREITAAVAKVEELFSEARSMFDACVKLRDFAFWQLKIYERYFADEALQAFAIKTLPPSKLWSALGTPGNNLTRCDVTSQYRIMPTQGRKLSAHALSNTGARRFLIVEFDFDTSNSGEEARLLTKTKTEGRDVRDLSAALLLHLAEKAPLALAVHSGGKSLHGWFYCPEIAEQKVSRFFCNAVSLGADRANWNPSQFARMPDGLRENGKRQTVYFFNPGVVK